MRENTLNHKQMVRVGVDTSKNVFQLHGVDMNEKTIVRKKLQRTQFLPFFANHPPCKIGLEACGSSHHWARELTTLGHEVVMIPAQHVKPFVMNNKNDAKDAEGICEAMKRTAIYPVAIKSIEQHDIQALHRIRERFVQNRTAQSSQIRGLLSELGLYIHKGISHVRKKVPLLLEDADNNLTAMSREWLSVVYDAFCFYDEKIQEIEKQINAFGATHPFCCKLRKIKGVGPLGSTILYAAVGNGAQYKNGRAMAASFGVVPRQHSTGGKEVLLSISKKGNGYVRKIMVNGARALLSHCEKNDDDFSLWMRALKERRGMNKAAIAVANKLLRIAWAVLSKPGEYDVGKCCTISS